MYATTIQKWLCQRDSTVDSVWTALPCLCKVGSKRLGGARLERLSTQSRGSPVPMSPQRRQLRSKVANSVLQHRPEAEIAEAKRAYKAQTANEYIQKLVDEAPRLTEEQLAHLRAILTPPQSAL